MSGGSRIVAIGTGNQEAAPQQEQSTAESAEEISSPSEPEAEEDELRHRASFGWVMPALASACIIGWTAFFIWANEGIFQSPQTPAQWTAWIRDWSIPVLLVCVLWLLALRNSRREAHRFGDVARLLREEAACLEARLTAMNRELSLAREFIASQSRDLETLGRVAGDRLSKHADRLKALIRENGSQVEALGSVSASALDNMERLRGQLPVIASAAKDVTNNIGNAGRTAHSQLQEMVNGFTRLNQFGQASERQVEAIKRQVEDALAEFTRQAEQLDEIATARFAALADRGSEFRTQLEGHEVQALATIRSRAATLAEELEETRQILDTSEAESLTSLRARMSALRDEGLAISRALRDGESTATEAWRASVVRIEEDMKIVIAALEQADSKAVESARANLAALAQEAARLDSLFKTRSQQFLEATQKSNGEAAERLNQQFQHMDAEISRRRADQEAQTSALLAQSERIDAQLARFGERLRELAAHGEDAEQQLSKSLLGLADRLSASRETLAGTGKAITDLTNDSVRLLQLIQAGSQHSREDLPQALAASEQHLAELEARMAALRDVTGEAGSHSELLSSNIIATRENLGQSEVALQRLHDEIDRRTAAHVSAIEGLRTSLEAVQANTGQLAEQAQSELRVAIDQLSTSAREAVAGIENLSASAIAEISQRLEVESAAAIDKAMRTRAAEAAGQLEQAAAHAAGVSREAAVQLRDQLAKVNELAANLETRVDQARQRAEEQVDNDFARRVALITEALNSNAIDIAKALSTDVTDTAWAAYMRGDRGIFTRRAVRLLDNSEAKAVAHIYESDRDFRSHVSHYIHDFESMLRQLLSTRDGHALGVTLLSSDMGKLYVALAQAIERLRN